MGYKKKYRARHDFMHAIRKEAVNHASNRIETLSSELDELDAFFQKANLGLEIKGSWVQRNMSYTAEMSVQAGQEKTNLLTFMITPLNRTEVFLIAQSLDGRSHKKYSKLDNVGHANRLVDAVRHTILQAIPDHLEEFMTPLIAVPVTDSLLDGHIKDKYSFATGEQNTEEVTEEEAAAHTITANKESLEAYLDALNYQ